MAMKGLAPAGALRGALESACSPGRVLSTTAGLWQRKQLHEASRAESAKAPENGGRLAARSKEESRSHGRDPRSRLRLAIDQRFTGRHAVFRSTVLHRFRRVLEQLSQSAFSIAGIGQDELNRQATLFMNVLDDSFHLAEQNITGRRTNSLFWNLREAFITKDLSGLTKELQYSFQSFIVRQRFSKDVEASQKKLLDLQFPHEWFPATRTMQRTIHLHVGPTNSGKTYQALKALEGAKRGAYAGPLRLLAAEVYARLNAQGRPCALLTGEEVRIPEHTDEYLTSCTVEMLPFNTRLDVAVIDEIQMIADVDRGSAWTFALLGVQAKEVHVCGEDRAVKLVQRLCATTGDECIVHRYERLSPLETLEYAIDGDFSDLQKGDCVVAFSRVSLYVLKKKIEVKTGRRCAIIYGSLPPEVRVQQAALFNNPNNDYDFVVASDAIGMGLNLEIRRVIFESTAKFDGSQNRLLTDPEIKQIGGRAGRYRTAQSAASNLADLEENVGYVTALEPDDLRNVQTAFTKRIGDIEAASVEPPEVVLERFASYFPPETPLSFILMRIKAAAVVNPRYNLTISSERLDLADVIQDIPLSIHDRVVLVRSPVLKKANNMVEILRAFAKIISTNSNGDLLSIQELPLEVLDLEMKDFEGSPQDFLFELESLHAAINLYLWLSYRYVGTFRSQSLAFHIKSLVEQRLMDALQRLDFTDADIALRRKRRRRQARARARAAEDIAGKDGDERTGEWSESPLIEVEGGLQEAVQPQPQAAG